MKIDDKLEIAIVIALIGYGVMATMGFDKEKEKLKDFKNKAVKLGYAEIVLPENATEETKPVFKWIK